MLRKAIFLIFYLVNPAYFRQCLDCLFFVPTSEGEQKTDQAGLDRHTKKYSSKKGEATLGDSPLASAFGVPRRGAVLVIPHFCLIMRRNG